VGPFYCPADQKVYLDLGFFDELERRFKAEGDFARAYVIAHEVGHHVQNLLGISDQVQAQRGRLSEAEANDLSVRLELQADFFAGVWAHHAETKYRILEPGDVEEAMTAAEAIGDDRLQMQSRGYVVPDSFTHGTSEQRVRWLMKGLQTGDMNQGDTFSAARL
jgi:predicted metalloprotease